MFFEQNNLTFNKNSAANSNRYNKTTFDSKLFNSEYLSEFSKFADPQPKFQPIQLQDHTG